MKLLDMLRALDIEELPENPEISQIVYDSRKVEPGCAFVCLKGSAVDGHKYAEEAARGGVAAIIAQEPVDISTAIPVVLVPDTRKALALMSAAFFRNPASKDIKVIGITGTKGKTTTAHMIKSILESAGHKTGIIGTIGVRYGDVTVKTENTTPASYEIQRFFREMADDGCEYCVMEVSSIGLRDLRVYGFEFDLALFTNFSEDHIGGVEHKDMEEYLESKRMLFKMCKLAVVNIDDPSWGLITKGHAGELRSYGFDRAAWIRAENYSLLRDKGFLGIEFSVCGDMCFTATVGIPGKFNAYNALAAIACCHLLDISAEDMNHGLRGVKVKGRVEPVSVPGNYTLLIDYAHNAVSMESILNTLREYKPHRLICMFGAGGNRPKVRRYEMGEVSGKLADLSVVTEDNSRFEDVMDIIADIRIGLEKTGGKYIEIPDRRQAIKYCMENAEDGDIIVLAGKGHEDYQETRGIKSHLDEREVIADIIRDMK